MALRGAGIDTTIVDDDGWSVESFQHCPSGVNVRKVKVVCLASVFYCWYDQHWSIDTVFVDEQPMRSTNLSDNFLWVRVDERSTSL